jgi:hypothetical protein
LKEIPPLLEAFSPLVPKPLAHFCGQLREGILSVPRKRTQVFLQNWFNISEVWQIEAFVKPLDLTDRILLHLFKTHLVKVTWRNQTALLEEYREELLVLSYDALVQVRYIRPLQTPPWPGLSHHVPG